MPGPPPPPPTAPPPMMPPPTPFTPSKGGPDDRSALLTSIRQGKKLKKAVTNDKSAPLIAGKVNNSNNNKTNNSSPVVHNSSSTPNGVALGGLFAGGMPKLRPTGILGSSNNYNSSSNSNNNISSNSSGQNKPEVSQQPRNFSSIQNELKKQLSSDSRSRGPPPPAPIRSVAEDSNAQQHHAPLLKVRSNGLVSPTSLSSHNPGLQINHSTLHRKVKSNVNLSTLDSSLTMMNGHNPSSKPVINHGKPNLAPKPPPLTGKPTAPPKKLLTNGKAIHRAQSMRSPRSPSPQSPDGGGGGAAVIKFGTVRNLSSVIGQTLANSTGNLSSVHRQRPALNGRPTAPPPGIPPQQPPPPPPQPSPCPSVHTPPPPSKMHVVRPPTEAPPPPPSHAPPPPPHRTHPMRPPPAVPNNCAPPPPPRNSSMTTPRRAITQDATLETSYQFTAINLLMPPAPFKNITKCYTNRQATSKQQAPQPPHLQASNQSRTWDTTASC